MYDDYIESRPGALDELKLLLHQYGFAATDSNDLESNHPQRTLPKPRGSVEGPKLRQSRGYDFRLPIYWQNQTRTELTLGRCRRKADEVQVGDKHNYILTCIPFGRSISKLYQPEVCTIDSDQDFFSLLRVTYRQCRTKIPLSFMRRVKSIHFVQVISPAQEREAQLEHD